MHPTSTISQETTINGPRTRCSLSAEHLRRLCRRELGRTPMEHVTDMRVQRAQALLATTEDKLDATAPQVGYRSSVVFSRAFVRCTGMTPTQYRERGAARRKGG